jgi:hypothetical protein
LGQGGAERQRLIPDDWTALLLRAGDTLLCQHGSCLARSEVVIVSGSNEVDERFLVTADH